MLSKKIYLGPSGIEVLRRYENGEYHKKIDGGRIPLIIKTKHPRIVYGVIKGKKSWGLWVKEWSMGISECNFTKKEILDQFDFIPHYFEKELDNRIFKCKIERNERYLKQLRDEKDKL